MNDNYMKTILSGVKEWTENLTDDAIDKANNALEQANKSIDKALYVVNLTMNSDGTLSADKTFEEITQAYKEGKYTIVLKSGYEEGEDYQYLFFRLNEITPDFINFITPYDSDSNDAISVSTVSIKKDNTIELSNTKLAQVPNPYPLTFTGAVNATYDGSSAKTIEIPSGGGGLGDFELIGTVDFSQEGMAAANAVVNFEVSDVSEILLISNDLVNSSSSNSNVLVFLNKNSGQIESMLHPDSGKSGTPLNGWVFIKHLSGVGLTGIQSSGAVSPTNYNVGAAKIPYNIRPLASDFKITDISIQNPPTQYYAVGGIVQVYVR